MGGDYTQLTAGTLEIGLGGTALGDSDLLAVAGVAGLSGTLSLSLIGDYVPVIGEQITILTAGVITGQFDDVQCSGAVGIFDVTYEPDAVVVTITGGPVVGDVNCDGVVGIEDFMLILGLWGPCPDPCPPSCPGDLDGDCEVGIGDFLLVIGNWT